MHLWVALRDKENLESHWQITKKVLLKDVGKINFKLISNAVYAFIGIGKDEIIPLLQKKLSSEGTATMAKVFLNSGHEDLENAGESWAKSNGYTIRSRLGSPSLMWGSM